MDQEIYNLEIEIVKVLKNIYDPEIPVDIFNLGLIYEINVDDNQNVNIRMTLTAPNCPMADELLDEVIEKVKGITGVKEVKLDLVFDPPWGKEMMSETALLELGML